MLETSDLPGGVVNIITGSSDHLTKYLAEHQAVDAMWYFGSEEGRAFVEHASAVNVKRTWVNYGTQRDWADAAQGQGEEFLYHATQVPTPFVPVPVPVIVPVPTFLPYHPGQKHLADHGGHLCKLSLLQLNEVKYVTSQNKPPQTASQENNMKPHCWKKQELG